MNASNSSGIKKVLFIAPYPPGTAGSQRFRFELFFDMLRNNGIRCDQRSFIDDRTWKILYLPGHLPAKIYGFLRGFAGRIRQLFQVPSYDLVFIHREAAPIGPPIFEWITAKIFRKPIIFDFDDAIWKRDSSKANRLFSILKQPQKTSQLCMWAARVSAGNEFLAAYARQFNKDTRVIPTVVDTDYRHNRLKDHTTGKLNIGWTGSHTTLKYLEMIAEVIGQLEKQYDFDFYVIADNAPELDLCSIRYIPWTKESEIEDLLKFNIGLMPLHNDQWEEGKCGFKIIQYLSLGIPGIASPVGVNARLVVDGQTGYTFSTVEQFKEKLIRLLEDRDLLTAMGKNGRELIVRKYSKQAQAPAFLELFQPPF